MWTVIIGLILGVALIVSFAQVIRLIAKGLLYLMNNKKPVKNHSQADEHFNMENPYIQYDLLKQRNEENYSEYQRWHAKNGTHQIRPKVVMKEDAEVEKKMKNLLR